MNLNCKSLSETEILYVTWAHTQIVTESGCLIDGGKIPSNRSDVTKVTCWGIHCGFSGWWIWRWVMIICNNIITNDRGYRHEVLITCKLGIYFNLKDFKIQFKTFLRLWVATGHCSTTDCFQWLFIELMFLFLFTQKMKLDPQQFTKPQILILTPKLCLCDRWHFFIFKAASIWPNLTAHLRAADADKWTWPTEDLGWYTR